MDQPKAVKSPHCSICKRFFPLKGTKSRTPLLLNCGHSACEGCILQEVSSKEEVKCSVCSCVSKPSPVCGEANVRKEYPINKYIYGGNMSKTESTKQVNSADANLGFSKIEKKKKLKQVVKCNECSATADISCVQCDAPYCNKCFDMVHKQFNVMKNHVKEHLKGTFEHSVPGEFAIDANCPVHCQQIIEFFCNDCGSTCCAYCITSEHKKHDVVILLEKNKNLLNDFVASQSKVSTVMKRLQSVIKLASQSVRKGGSEEGFKIEGEIRQHFHRMHGLLILQENEILTRLHAPHAKCIDDLKAIVQDTEMKIEELNELLQMSDQILKKGSKNLASINMTDLLTRLQENEDVPCFLLSDTPEHNSKFVVDEDFITTFSQHCELQMDENTLPRYWLAMEQELPADYEIESFPELKTEDQQDSENLIEVRGNSTSSSSITLSVRDVNQGNLESFETQGEGLDPGSHIKVNVSHMTSPSDFYVQTQWSQRQLINLEPKFSKTAMGLKKYPTNIFPGKVFLVQYELDKNWYRGRISKVLEEDTLFEVLYIDYGNTEVVPKERLRLVPPDFLKIPPLALHCRLFNCIPADGKKWSVQALSIMTQLPVNGNVSMVVQRKYTDLLEVDLYQYRNGSNMSLQQSLVFLSLAVLSDSCDVYMPTQKRPPKRYPSRLKLKEGDTLDVVTTSIKNPYDFYILDVATSSKTYDNIRADMQILYSKSGHNDRFNVYHPQTGMVVAALSKFDNLWHRAEILDVPVSKFVRIFLLDCGIEEIISWSNIKALGPKFFRFPPLAIHCKLSDVAPLEGDNWTEGACLCFESLAKDPMLRMLVCSEEEDHYSVVLYKVTPESDICINALLVREQLVKGTGVNSTIVDFPKVPIPDNLDHVELPCLPLLRRKKQPNQEIPIILPNPNYEDITQIQEGDGPVKVKVSVRRIITPDELYLVPVFMDKNLESTKKAMNTHYENIKAESVEEVDWKVEDLCAVRYPLNNSLWHRASILEKCEEKFKVILLDEGLEELVKAEDMRKLSSEFQITLQASVRCHLAGIKTPIMGDKWPMGSTVQLKDIIEANQNEIFMTKMGEVKERSLPIELFIRKVIPAGPFDPERIAWTNVNNQLRLLGYAQSDGSKVWHVDETTFQKLGTREGGDDDATMLKKNFKNEENVKIEKRSTHSVKKIETQCPFSPKKIETRCPSSPKKIEKQPTPQSKKIEKQPTPPPIEIANNIRSRNSTKHGSWLDPEPFENLEFRTAPGYVDNDANVYIGDYTKNASVFKFIDEALEQRYGDTEPSDVKWKPGQMCIAQYHVDNKWYRGEVIKVEDDDIKVKFVDYGNTESCSNSELRPNVFLEDIPILCQKCCLHTVIPNFPNETWSEHALDYFHYSVVEKPCRVRITELVTVEDNPDGAKYGIDELWLSDDTEFIASLVRDGYVKYKFEFEPKVDKGYPKFTDPGPDVVIESDSLINETTEEEENDESNNDRCNSVVSDIQPEISEKMIDGGGDCIIPYKNRKPKFLYWAHLLAEDKTFMDLTMTYKEMDISEGIEELTVELGAILSPTLLLLNISRTNDIVLSDIKKEFDEMSSLMQKEAEKQPLIEKPYLFKPCCARFSADKKWYRGIIVKEEEDQNKLVIQYVDYGNVEALPAKEVHELKQEWLLVEVQAIFCSLFQLRSTQEFGSVAFKMLSESLSYKPLTARIMKHGAPLEVKIYNEGKLAYQELLEKEYFEEESS